MDVCYVPAERREVQGKEYEIYKKYDKEWNIKPQGKGNGNWLLTKPSNVIVNGRKCRRFVLNHYNRQKLTQNIVIKFIEDIENGNINVDDITYD